MNRRRADGTRPSPESGALPNPGSGPLPPARKNRRVSGSIRAQSGAAPRRKAAAGCCAGHSAACWRCFCLCAWGWADIWRRAHTTIFCGWSWSSCRTGMRPFYTDRTARAANGWNMPASRQRSKRSGRRFPRSPLPCSTRLSPLRTSTFIRITACPSPARCTRC